MRKLSQGEEDANLEAVQPQVAVTLHELAREGAHHSRMGFKVRSSADRCPQEGSAVWTSDPSTIQLQVCAILGTQATTLAIGSRHNTCRFYR